MHPTLALHLHPGCTEVIEALERCHAEHTTTRYLGACNAAKQAVNECFKKEKRERQTQAQADAKRRAEALRIRMEEFNKPA